MKSRKTIIRRAFWRDLEKAAAWYEKQRPGLSYEFEEEVIATVFCLEERTESFAMWREPVRRALVKRFPYRIGLGPSLRVGLGSRHARSAAVAGTAAGRGMSRPLICFGLKVHFPPGHKTATGRR